MAEISSIDRLRDLVGVPMPAARDKDRDRLEEPHRQFIADGLYRNP